MVTFFYRTKVDSSLLSTIYMEPTGTLSERFMRNKSGKSTNAWAKLKLTSDIIICYTMYISSFSCINAIFQKYHLVCLLKQCEKILDMFSC